MDIRRIQTLKDKEESFGSRTRVKVVKNKVAPPFRSATFDILYGQGISRSGELIDLGLEAKIIEQSGSWFAFGSEKLGQGREKVRALLDEDPELRRQIEAKVTEFLGMHPQEFTPAKRIWTTAAPPCPIWTSFVCNAALRGRLFLSPFRAATWSPYAHRQRDSSPLSGILRPQRA